MPKTPFAGFLQYLYRLYPDHVGCSDGELLRRFVALKDETAFAALISRHGRLVQGVCRRILGDFHFAEDSFQATFLVLARRAKSIRTPKSLATWLHAVAQRIALRARAKTILRHEREREARTMARGERIDEATWQELRMVLDEEIGRLAEKYRSPLLLCHFEGKTRERIAQELGWPEGTVARRLTRGRELLKRQLTRRGIALPTAALTAALTEICAGAPVAVALTTHTIEAAISVFSGQALAAGCVSAQALLLAEEAMSMSALKGKLAILLIVVSIAIGDAGYRGYAGLSTTESQAAQQVAQKPPAAKDSVVEDDSIVVSGVVVDKAGKPVKGAKVEIKKTDAPAPVVTEDDGVFRFRLTQLLPTDTLLAQSRDGNFLASARLERDVPGPEVRALRLVLKPAKMLEVAVTDGAGKPVAGAGAGVVSYYNVVSQGITDNQGRAILRTPPDSDIRQVFAWKNSAGFDYRSFQKPVRTTDPNATAPALPAGPILLKLEGARTLRVHVVDGDGKPIVNMSLYPWYFRKPGESTEINSSWPKDMRATTDENGVAVWTWLPTWQQGLGEQALIQIWPLSKEYERVRLAWNTKDTSGTAKLVLQRLVPLSGKVTHADGAPAKGITIRAAGQGYTFDGFHGETKTKADGTYELKVTPNLVYLVVAGSDKWAAQPQTGFAAFPKTPVANKNFVLQLATKVFGRLMLGKDQRPYAGQLMTISQKGKDLHSQKDVVLPNPEKSKRWVQPTLGHGVRTDADGRFEFHAGPGEYNLHGPSQIKPISFTITDQPALEFNINAPREEKGLLKGLVVMGNPPKPVSKAKISGVHRSVGGRDIDATTDAQGRFEAIRSQHRLVLHAKSADGKLAGIVEIGPQDATVAIPLAEVAALRGRLVDGETGDPLPGREIVYGTHVPNSEDDKSPFRTAFGGKVKTDDHGRFELTGISVGRKYQVSVTMGEGNQISWRPLHTLVAKPGELIELGDVKVTPEHHPPTMDESRRAAFDAKGTPLERFENACRDARLSLQHVLVILAPTKSELTERLFAMTRDRDELRPTMDDFRTIWIATDDERRPAAELLAKRLGQDLSKIAGPILVITDPLGAPGKTKDIAPLPKDMFTVARVAEFLKDAAPRRLDAHKLLADALAQAAKENKRVLVQETATWCGPCWHLSRFLDRHREVWEKDYIWIKLDERWTGSTEIARRLHAEAWQPKEGTLLQGQGIPWTVILDASGKVLNSSTNKQGMNIGFPSQAEGVAHFLEMLRTTAQRLSADEIGRLEEALKAEKGP
jgi:RNA polymerase sigma factor (sigma-70 family)